MLSAASFLRKGQVGLTLTLTLTLPARRPALKERESVYDRTCLHGVDGRSPNMKLGRDGLV
jgi:hypothetical protein